MLDDLTIENVQTTLGESLQEIAFLFSDPIYDDDYPDFEDWNASGVSMTFSGSPSGLVQLIASNELLINLAENLVGISPDSDEALEMGQKALMEVLNIFIGNFLTREFGVQKVFDLSIPEQLGKDNWPSTKEECIWLSVEDYHMCIFLAMQE